MTVRTIKLTTIKELKEFIKDIPDDKEINIENVGDTGFIDDTELELIVYESGEIDINLNIKAESGYVY
jgi:hypothetical protein